MRLPSNCLNLHHQTLHHQTQDSPPYLQWSEIKGTQAPPKIKTKKHYNEICCQFQSRGSTSASNSPWASWCHCTWEILSSRLIALFLFHVSLFFSLERLRVGGWLIDVDWFDCLFHWFGQKMWPIATYNWAITTSLKVLVQHEASPGSPGLPITTKECFFSPTLWGKSPQVSTASALLRHCAGPRFRKADGLKDAPENTGKQGGIWGSWTKTPSFTYQKIQINMISLQIIMCWDLKEKSPRSVNSEFGRAVFNC